MSNSEQKIVELLREAIIDHNTINFSDQGKNRVVNPHFYVK